MSLNFKTGLQRLLTLALLRLDTLSPRLKLLDKSKSLM